MLLEYYIISSLYIAKLFPLYQSVRTQDRYKVTSEKGACLGYETYFIEKKNYIILMGTLQLSDMWNGLRDCSRMTLGRDLRGFGSFD